jgi:hypothetical protein
LLHDPQAQAKAAVVMGRHGTFETTKDTRLIAGIDPDTAIANHQRCDAGGGPQRNLDRFARSELQRVDEQVRDDLIEALTVPGSNHERGHIHDDVAARLCRIGGQPVHHALYDLDQVDLFTFHLETSSGDGRDIDQAADQPLEAINLPAHDVELPKHQVGERTGRLTLERL